MPKAKRRQPKTVLEKVIAAIIDLDKPTGSSRKAIANYLKTEFAQENPAALRRALKAGVAQGKLETNKASFLVVGHTPSPALEEAKVVSLDKKLGTGAGPAGPGDVVTVSYIGTLEDGSEFDRASSFTFRLSAGEVIKGWDIGIQGMCVGGKRQLSVPSKLGYGKRGAGKDIPPNSDLSFVVTLKGIQQSSDE